MQHLKFYHDEGKFNARVKRWDHSTPTISTPFLSPTYNVLKARAEGKYRAEGKSQPASSSPSRKSLIIEE